MIHTDYTIQRGYYSDSYEAFKVTGKDTIDYFQRISTNDFSHFERFQVCSTLLLSAKGRIIDYIRYAVSLPIDVAIVGSQTMAHAEESLQAVRNFKPMADQEKWALEQEAKSIATPEIMWWKRRA